MGPVYMPFAQLSAMAVPTQMRLLFRNGTKVPSSCPEGAPYSNSSKGWKRLAAALEVILISSWHSHGYAVLPARLD